MDILDSRRIPVNADERAGRVGTVPYYGATGQVGWIDAAIFDEELVLLGEDGAPFFDRTRDVAYRITGPAWVNNHAHVLRAGKRLVNRFLLHQLNQVDYRPFVSGTTRAKLPQGPMREITLVVPPVDEQHRIVAAIETHFSRLDSAVASLKRAKAHVRRDRASVLKAGVEGRLVPTEAALARAEGRDYEIGSLLMARILAQRREAWAANGGRGRYKEPEAPETKELPNLPEGWCWVTLDGITGHIDGGNSATATSDATSRRVLRSSAVRQGSVDWTDHRFLPEDAPHGAAPFVGEGQLLFTRLSGSLSYVGNCSFIRNAPGNFEFPDRIFRASPVPCVSGAFVQHCFGVAHLRVPLESKAKSTAGHQRISLSDLRAFALPLPPLAEQGRIAAEVDRRLSVLDALDATLDASLARCARLRQSILKLAFEGQLVRAGETSP